MAFPLSAEEMGFTVCNTDSPNADTICIDGLNYPKCIPEPIFEDATDVAFTSDKAQDCELTRSLLPSYHTPSHCIIIPRSHIPSDSVLCSELEDKEAIIQEINDTTEALKSLKQDKSKYTVLGDLDQANEYEKAIDEILLKLIHLQLILDFNHVKDIEITANSIYITEVNRFLSALDDLFIEFQRDKKKDQCDDLETDRDVLAQLLENYEQDPQFEDEVQLCDRYNNLMNKYFSDTII